MNQLSKVHFLKKIVAFIFLLLLTGCATQFVYNSLPFWVDYYVSDFVDMSDKQQEMFDADIAVMHQWHREKELPKLKVLIEQAEQDLSKGMSLQDVMNYDAQIKTRLIVLLDNYQLFLTRFFQSLSDAQVKRLLVKMDEKMTIAKEKRLNKSIEKQKYEYLNRLFKRANFWIGRIDNSQKSLFIPLMNNHFAMSPFFIDISLQLRTQFEQLLVRRHQISFNQDLEAFLKKMIMGDYQAHQVKWADHRKKQWVLIHTLLLDLTPKQKKHLLKKLQSIKNDFVDLME